MEFHSFMSRVIDDGIAAAEKDYAAPRQEQKKRGAVDGFNLCRGKGPIELRDLWMRVSKEREAKFCERSDDYWYWACRAAEVEWACNCASAAIVNEGGEPLLSWLPTARGVMKAAEILGVAEVRP